MSFLPVTTKTELKATASPLSVLSPEMDITFDTDLLKFAETYIRLGGRPFPKHRFNFTETSPLPELV